MLTITYNYNHITYSISLNIFGNITKMRVIDNTKNNIYYHASTKRLIIKNHPHIVKANYIRYITYFCCVDDVVFLYVDF